MMYELGYHLLSPSLRSSTVEILEFSRTFIPHRFIMQSLNIQHYSRNWEIAVKLTWNSCLDRVRGIALINWGKRRDFAPFLPYLRKLWQSWTGPEHLREGEDEYMEDIYPTVWIYSLKVREIGVQAWGFIAILFPVRWPRIQTQPVALWDNSLPRIVLTPHSQAVPFPTSTSMSRASF